MESHTEDEARKKWCPFARVRIEGGTMGSPTAAAVNRFVLHGVDKGTLCIASNCMLWQWDEREQANVVYRSGMSQGEKIELAKGRAAGQPPKPELGYCGAAR